MYFSANYNNDTYFSGRDIGVDQYNIRPRLSATSSFGSDHSLQVSSGTYLRFKLFKKDRKSLYFRPRMNITAGNQTFYQESGTIFIGGIEYVDYVENNIFDFINIQFNLPLLFTANNFDFELGYGLNMPQDNGSDSVFKNTSFLNLSAAYLLEL